MGTLEAVGTEYQLIDDPTTLVLAHVVTGRYGEDDVVGLPLDEAWYKVFGEVEEPIVKGHIEALNGVTHTQSSVTI